MSAPKTVTTGISGLDAQVGGGLRTGSCHIIVTTEPMNAYELLAYHAASGASQATRGCYYFTTDTTKQQVTEGLTRVKANLSKVNITEMPDKQHGWSFPDPTKNVRYIIDNASTWMRTEGFDKAYKRLLELRTETRTEGNDLIILITQGLHNDQELTLLKQWADGVFELGFDKQGFGLFPYLKITKLRGIPDSSRFVLFKEQKQGIFIESTRRVN